MWRILPVLCAASSAIALVAEAQIRTPDPRGRPPWADTASESGIYPVGDAVGVYTAVLDLFFVEGDESPRIIVMHDTAETRHSGGPCPYGCEQPWPHKSKIDTATILAFARLSPKRPRIVPFGYPIPITLSSWEQDNRLRTDVLARREREGRNNGLEEFEFASEFAKRYPGAWGKLALTKVGFNRSHTEALVQASFNCGGQCHSDEILFLRKIGTQWRVVERIPNDADATMPTAGMRYRGPDGRSPSESVILPPASTTRAKTESADAATVYRTVLDSLYNFHGESPRRIVLTDWFPADGVDGVPAHARPIEPGTLKKYAFLRTVRPPLDMKLNYRLPVSTLSRDSVPMLERLGKPLEKQLIDSREMSESTPFWLAFRQHYPGAWGMVGFTRAAFNETRTQALLFTHHACGNSCHNADTWLLERTEERWRIVERIPRTKESQWELDSLRYLGVDANPRAYGPRRIRGRFVVAATGKALPGLSVLVERGPKSSVLKTDSVGGYSLDSLPLMGAVILKVPCPAPSRRQPLFVAMLPSHPGIDSTIDVRVDLRQCLGQKRARPLLAGRVPPQAEKSTYPSPEVEAVYRGVLDALYPYRRGSRGPILLQPFTVRACDWCVDAEMPRLIKQGIIDSSTARNFLKLPGDSVWFRPRFAYSRQVIFLSPAEQKFLIDQAESVGGYDKKDVSLTALARDAYPGTDSIWSLSRVAFNDEGTQALVQVGTKTRHWLDGETMLLRKSPRGWRAVRRHLEREETAGMRVGGRCEPTDAPSGGPSLTKLERFVGDAYVSSIGTSPQLRGHSGTMHLRFTPTDTLHRFYWLPSFPGDKRKPIRLKNRQVLATVQSINDSTGKAREGIAGSLELRGNTAMMHFHQHKEGSFILDGWSETYTIMRVDGREFFGNWSMQSGPTIPWKGYFCGRFR